MKDLKELFSYISQEGFLYLVLSKSLDHTISKVTCRPIHIKEKLYYQMTRFKENQAIHENYVLDEFLNMLTELVPHKFHQALISFKGFDIHLLCNKKGKVTLLKRPPTRSNALPIHNKQKNYLLEEGNPIPFLQALKIMDHQGRVYHKMQDKFRQLNRFLEMVRDVLPHLDKSKTIHIVDFGCGKAYLTFALHHFLKQEGYSFEITGLDLKKEVIAFCENLKNDLNMQGLQFLFGDINSFQTEQHVDMMISLHACDTATDAAIEKAVKWNAKVILAVPCCQHELFSQVQSDVLNPLLQHGILKERFASLLTDTCRAKILELLGYQVQVLEFIDLEHTPKNILIRAIKHSHTISKTKLSEYHALKEAFQITPDLEKRFFSELSHLILS